MHELTGRGDAATCDWFDVCRVVCSQVVSVNNRAKMVSIKEEPVQTDKARFAGSRRYKTGKLRQDHVPE